MPKVEDTRENAEACLQYCKPCLTYPGVEGEALFCARGKTSSPKAKKGCNCGICEVRKKYGCDGFYYCLSKTCE